MQLIYGLERKNHGKIVDIQYQQFIVSREDY